MNSEAGSVGLTIDQDQNQQKLVPAVERAAIILDIVALSRRYLTISELAREARLPKSTVHSLCSTLVQLELLIRRPDQTYILGPHLLRWANAFERQTDVATEFAGLWDQIEIEPDAVVSLAVPEQAEVVFIAARQTGAGQRVQLRPGMRLPASQVAAGRAILSLRSDFEIRRLFSEAAAGKAGNAIPDIEAFLETIRKVRDLGYARDDNGFQNGISGLAAPVLNSLNQPLAAVMISMTTEMLDTDGQEAYARLIVDIASRLSRRMGADLSRT